MMTSPPRPPSPPEGPPRGTYFSLRKATHPLPPSPAFTAIFASSTNINPSLFVLPHFLSQESKGQQKLVELHEGIVPRLCIFGSSTTPAPGWIKPMSNTREDLQFAAWTYLIFSRNSINGVLGTKESS